MNVSRLRVSLVILLMAIGLLSYRCPVQSAQQQTSDGPSDNAPFSTLSDEQSVQSANQLIESINSSHAVFQRYTQDLKNASSEDKLVLELQIWSQQQRVLNEAHQLADELMRLEKKSPQPDLRNQIETIFSDTLPRFQFYIKHLRNEIDQVRASRPEAAVDQRFSLEVKVNRLTMRLDGFFDMYLRHVQKMEQVSRDDGKARSDLARLLSDRADELSGRILLALSRIDALEERLKEIPDDAEVVKLLAASSKSLDTNAASLGVILDLMDELELDTEVLRTQLVTATHDYSSSLTDTSVAIGLLGRISSKAIGWLSDNGPKYVLRLILVVGILFIFYVAKRVIKVALQKAITVSKFNLSQLAQRMIVTGLSNLVMLVGLILALSQLGISLAPMLAGLGIVGFIVGFALQDTLGNFASGMMILLYRPYDVGDLVEVGDVNGYVNKMSLVSTSILTIDNQVIVIPNNKIWGDVIRNLTARKKRRVDMVFGISYADDIPKAEKILEDILVSHDLVLDHPEPMVRLHALGSSSVDFVVRPWVKVRDYWDVYWDVTRTVKLRFDEEGISIPFPQRDVHVYYGNPPKPAIESSSPEKATG